MNKELIKKEKTYSIKVTGIVQGVGFRPFIFNLASRFKLKGMVTNTTEAVDIVINTTSKKTLAAFMDKINKDRPSAAYIERIVFEQVPYRSFNNFSITKSKKSQNRFQLVSPDLATCQDCISDINNSSFGRRYGYPFTNCTNCGPRFTIMESFPYDRYQTTMKKFEMCKDCQLEYQNPFDRRFHAQPNACHKCGPKLWLVDNKNNLISSTGPLEAAARKLKQGHIIALKSLGGFQLAVDATNPEAVIKLRNKKNRPHKPLAVMVRNIETVKKNFTVSQAEIKMLTSPSAPIVLLNKKNKNFLAEGISFYNRMDGIMLPYTPIHHLLFNLIDFPLVMTSGNNSEEPIAKDNQEALEKLSPIAGYFLLHDRDIYSRYDDSVVKEINKNQMIIRRARGFSPYPIKIGLDIGDKCILAVGAQEKNTFCVLTRNYAIISQHLGELDDADSFAFFKETLEVYKRLFNVTEFDLVAHDLHPGYTSSKFAQHLGIPTMGIQHHQAHMASVIAENNLQGDVLGITWDGTGLGLDEKIWGSEILLLKEKQITRLGNLSEKLIPGGEAAIRNPYRMAISYLLEIYRKQNRKQQFSEYIYDNCPHFIKLIGKNEIEILKHQLEIKFNSPATTSMGRFFDAVSSILNLTSTISYEGQAAIHLESIADLRCTQEYRSHIDHFCMDDMAILEQILEDIKNKVPASIISAKFHNTLASAILDICKIAQDKYNIFQVALSGGVFQNTLLLKNTLSKLSKQGFEVFSNYKAPVNDGGISLGQAYMAALELERSNRCV
ncbi:MAG: carbamoyltransferase HypF [Actinomycetota bacterium]|nr:carbamoyltransferase HypF [Actinomycetota bacterium]